MATQKKTTAPDFYWVVWQNEIVSMVDGTSSDIIFFQRLMLQFFPRPMLLDVVAFCEGPEPFFSEPTMEDWRSGLAPYFYEGAVLLKLFNLFAEEI